MTNKVRNEIVLNRMFTGEFLDDHIGHEIVNMYKDDKGRNYVYIQPYGTYQASHHGKIEAVLMVRSVPGKGALEVLGLATGLTDIFDPTLDCHKQWEVHTEYIHKEEITYGGLSILDIFDRSKEKEGKQPVYFTMKAERVMRPNKKVYIIYGEKNTIGEDDIKIVNLKSNQAKCSLKQYFDPLNKETIKEDYFKLKELIECDNLWTKDTYPIGDVRKTEIKEDDFWDICGVGDYELAFSNAIEYYMKKYPELATEFSKNKFGKYYTGFHVLREWENIDLLLENDDTIVVIENKITSKINGIKIQEGKPIGNQLGKYHKIALEKAKGEFLDKEDPMRTSLQKNPKETVFLILTPDYNPINLYKYDTEEFACSKYYQQIFYSEAYAFLEKKHPEDQYFQEFLKGMKKHTSKYHADLFEDTRIKFIKQIKKHL